MLTSAVPGTARSGSASAAGQTKPSAETAFPERPLSRQPDHGAASDESSSSHPPPAPAPKASSGAARAPLATSAAARALRIAYSDCAKVYNAKRSLPGNGPEGGPWKRLLGASLAA